MTRPDRRRAVLLTAGALILLLVLGLLLWRETPLALWPKTSASAFTLTLAPSAHGSVRVAPAPAANGKYPAGTLITVTAIPDAGYGIDSTWYSVPGRWGQMYHEQLGSELRVIVDQDKNVGASFVPAGELQDVVVTQDIQYAKPGVKALKYDVYAPPNAHDLPIIVIIHGGGWATNDQKGMRQLARELLKGGRFVVVSLDYRWYGTADGDATPNGMADLIDDVFGGIAHIQEHAAEYGGDPTHIGITGDSSGGHLAAVASLMTAQIGSGGFGKVAGVYEFQPSYLPAGKSIEQVRVDLMAAIRAGAPNYALISADGISGFIADRSVDRTTWQAISPLEHVPAASTRSVPQFILRGSEDTVVGDTEVQTFISALTRAGQRAVYSRVNGAGHAFFDWKPDPSTQSTFAKYGVNSASELREFFLSTLY